MNICMGVVSSGVVMPGSWHEGLQEELMHALTKGPPSGLA